MNPSRHRLFNRLTLLALTFSVAAITGCGSTETGEDASASASADYTAQTRTYYVAAEPVDWDYAPLGTDPVAGEDIPAPYSDQLVYSKLRYIQYSDETFTTPVEQPEPNGILGPTIRGVVGDTIKVVFLNRTEQSLSMHPHGVTYDAENEGALYEPNTGGGASVAPGASFTYTWTADAESGPREGEPSSKVWLYHSHVNADEEIYAGLMGTIVITDPAHALPDGSPDDVDREFTTLFMVFNENGEGEEDEGHLKHAINGRFFGNLQGLEMNQGERVRWYLLGLGTEVDLHTVHWHGETVLLEGSYTDVVELLPASMRVADMDAENPGTWIFHCHIGDHMMAGMYTTYTIH